MKNTNIKSLGVVLTLLFSVAGFNTGWTKNVEDKTKDAIDQVANFLKKGVDQLGEDLSAVQKYLDNYHWKGLVQDTASSNGVTLKYLNLNGHSKAVVVRPGERIEGNVLCNIDSSQCSSLQFYRVVLGLKGVGAQTTIGNELGLVAGESQEKFVLIAPKEPGLYQVRFKLVESLLEENALKSWVDGNGHEPDGTTTIGVILVKE